MLTELAERQNRFPGVVQEQVSIRSYPYGEMAASVLGHVGQVLEKELEQRAFKGVKQGTVVGQEGLEYYYDRYLRGRDGEQRVQVNSAGYPVPTRLQPTPPTAGYSLKTTLDLPLQREGEKALLQGIENARAGGKPAPAGGFVAMNPLNGEVLAIGSYPSFDPNKFAKPLTEHEYHELEGVTGSGGSEEVPSRLVDRAVNGAYPTGSTFKPITAMAALEGGVINPTEGLGAGQCIDVGGEQFCNAGHADYGAVGLVEALKVSSDTYFFTVGDLANSHGNVIQNKAHELGIGEQTGIDLPSETTGTVPSRQWLVEQNEAEYQCQREHHGHPCHIVAEPGEPWTVGYNMDLAVGQGSLQTNPLQMAVAYSTLANAYLHGGYGEVVRPHLGLQIDESSTGGLVQSAELPARAPRAPELRRPQPRDGRHPRGRQPAWRHLRGRVGGLEPGTAPGLRQDRHRRTSSAPGTVVVHVLHRRPHSPDRDRGDRRRRRIRRGNRRADRAVDRLQVVRSAREVRRGNLENLLIAHARAPEQPDQSPRAHRAAARAPSRLTQTHGTAARPAVDARRDRPGDRLGDDARRRPPAKRYPAIRATTSTARPSTW